MTQRTLFEAPMKPDTPTRWAEFKAAHPGFVREAARQAREHKAAGNERWSMKAIFELNRHKFRRGKGQPGLDNSFTSFAAREVMREYPDLEGFFEIR